MGSLAITPPDAAHAGNKASGAPFATQIEATAHLAAIVESSDDAIISKGLDGIIRSWNRAAEALFGYTAEEAIGKSVLMLIPENRKEEENIIMGRIVAGQRMDHFETVRVRKDGTLLEVSITVSPIVDASGRIAGASKIARDIGLRKRADEANRRLASIVESSDDAIISKNLDGIIQSWNGGAKALFGYEAEEVIGRSVSILIPPSHGDEEPNILARIRRGERIDHYETVRVRKDGSFVDVSLTVSPIKDARGRVVGASKIVRDIGERKKGQRALAEAHESVIRASRAKDEFLAALSHELRTPLNPVLLLASSGAEDLDFSERARNDFSIIRKNVELEGRLIDDLLDITRITRGKMPLILAPLNVHAVLDDAVAVMRDDIAQKKLTLVVSMHALHPIVSGDAIRLQQIFWNVLKNAVKFTPENGKITVTTRDNSDRGMITVMVSDTGIGISADERDRVFDAFSQGEHASASGSHRFGGLGLGLTITRMLMEMHKGAIRAESEGRDLGATFVMELPLMTPDAIAAFSETAASDRRACGEYIFSGNRSRHTILLVEDHAPTRETLGKLLGNRRFEVLLAGNVKEARAQFGKGRIDILISDIGLPDGTGYELMAELCAKRNVVGIALTGYGMEEDISLSRKAGFVFHLTKPVTIQALDQALAGAVAKLKE
jgi:PAS domain S-box-containing protein